MEQNLENSVFTNVSSKSDTNVNNGVESLFLQM